jgi:hypothetical protein
MVPPPSTPSSRPKVRLGVRGGAALASTPAPTAALSADLGLGWEFFSISLEGRADLPVTAAVDTGARVRTSILAGSVVPCGHYGWFVGCGLLSVGSLRVEGVDLAKPLSGSSAYLAAGLRAGIEWPIPGLPVLALRASGDALVTVHPIRAARADGREVWRTPPFSALLGGGLVARF